MNSIISSLYYSPVKSLSFQNIKKCIVKKDIGFLNDRIFAFSRNLSKDKAEQVEKDPMQRKLVNFLTLKNSPVLNKYNFEFKDDKIYLMKDNQEIISISLDKDQQRQELSDKLLELDVKLLKPSYLLKNEFYPFYDTTHSEKVFNTISLINLNSVKDFEIKIGKTIEFQRFRGNIYVKDLDAWKEREWLGKILLINDIQFKVLKYIPRCSATNLKVNSDDIDINIPSQLKKTYNHMDMGVYLLPLDSGQISEGDKITLS
jgi:uncharacterized protein YcbX